MLTLNYICENKSDIIKRLLIRGFEAEEIIDNIIKYDQERKNTQADLDKTLSELNMLSKQIGLLYKDGKTDEANQAKEQTVELKEDVKGLKERYSIIEKELYDLLIQIPNVPEKSVPKGKSDAENILIRQGGK